MNKDKTSPTYKLIHTGLPFIDSVSGLYVIPCHFQLWLVEEETAATTTILTRFINSNLAGELICGSLWTNWKNSDKDIHYSSSDSQVFWTGANPLFITRLKDVVNLSTLTPASFWLTQGATWVTCLNFGRKKIIIPYFELLRVLFYQASRRLTQFFFSQLPLGFLCRPLNLPTVESPFLTRFCVASTDLSAAEARVLGGLLSDPSMMRTLNFAQAYLRNIPIIKPTSVHNLITRNIGQLSKNILFNSNGYNFTQNNESYFWVNSLEIVTSPYNFRQVIFYPIENSKSYSHTSDKLPLCSDLLQANVQYDRLTDLYHHSTGSPSLNHRMVSDTKSKREDRYIKGLDIHLPNVERGIPWARIPVTKKDFYWFNESSISRIDINHNSLNKESNYYTKEFSSLLSKFKDSGYPINFLKLNNMQELFGKNLSVFPVRGHSPLPNSIYRDSIKSFALVEIEFFNGPIFLAQPFPQECPNLVILFQKQDLSYPSDSEFNSLLDVLYPIYNYDDFNKFRKRTISISRKKNPYNLALIALPIPIKKVTVKLCADVATHTISKFRKRLQFLVASLQKYPLGTNEEQRKTITNISRNTCMSPDANLLAMLASYW